MMKRLCKFIIRPPSSDCCEYFRSSVKSSNSGCVSAIRTQDPDNISVLKSNSGS
ncbi:hypothetical protein Hanom_Chr03g00249531 [Helianthus anomalus]